MERRFVVIPISSHTFLTTTKLLFFAILSPFYGIASFFSKGNPSYPSTETPD